MGNGSEEIVSPPVTKTPAIAQERRRLARPEPDAFEVTARAELYDRSAATLTVPAVVHLALVGRRSSCRLRRRSRGPRPAPRSQASPSGSSPARPGVQRDDQCAGRRVVHVHPVLAAQHGARPRYSAVFDRYEQYTGSSGHGGLVG